MDVVAARDVEQFRLHKKVYEGKSSVVYTATDSQSGQPVAMKLYKKKMLRSLNQWVKGKGRRTSTSGWVKGKDRRTGGGSRTA